MKPNIVERLENLIAFLDEARQFTENDDSSDALNARMRIDDADGVAGEILTMIDGR